jgi:hypothetical protein
MSQFFDKPLVMTSAFSAAMFIDRWLWGMGGNWLTYLERFIERKQRQGCDGMRVFGETTNWDDRDDNPNNDHPFFNHYRCTSLRMWDYNALRRDQRPERLTVHNQLLILKLMELAQKRGFKIEYVTDATLKGNYSWNVIGQCIRETAYFFRCVDTNNFDLDHLGHETNHELTDKVGAAFDRIVKPIRGWWTHETHNEWDAHSKPSWEMSDMDRAAALAEVNNQLRRHHEKEDHWPEGEVGVSHGGRDSIEYRVGPPLGCDVIRIHPSRSGNWSEVGNRFKHLESHGQHIYMNETKHFIDPDYWWTIDQGWFRLGSSTKDVARILRFEQECLAKGYSFCRHGLVDMACGMWVDGDVYVDMALDARERATGGGSPPPPPPPKYKYLVPVDLAYRQLLGRPADPGGLAHYDALMESGMTEADMREQLIRSQEYEDKNG